MSYRSSRPVPLAVACLLAVAMFPFAAPAADTTAVGPPSAELVTRLHLSDHYKKCVMAHGFPILGSAAVSDAALLEAAFLIDHELGTRDDLRQAMIRNKVRFVVMGAHEYTTSVPEHSDLKPAKYWDKRARGLGATTVRPAVSCGEENLLCLAGDPYATENILVHEFAHAIHEMGLNTIDPTFDKRLQETYDHAMATGLWKGKYASTNRMEYWAEGVQSWFDTNRQNDHDHNHVHLRSQLKEYDPQLAALIAKELGDGQWRYTRPMDRPAAERTHFAGVDVAHMAPFAWPTDLQEWGYKNAAKKMAQAPDLKDLPVIHPAEDAIPPSRGGGKATTITFVNLTQQDALIFWIDFDGKRRPNPQRLRPSIFIEEETYVGHTWLMTDTEGKTLGVVVADPQPGKSVINPTPSASPPAAGP